MWFVETVEKYKFNRAFLKNLNEIIWLSKVPKDTRGILKLKISKFLEKHGRR